MFPTHFHVADFGIFAVVALITLVVILLSLCEFGKSSKGSNIPGPDPSDPMLGNLGDMQTAGSLYQYLQQLHKTHGKIISFWWGKTYTVSVACPYLWKDIQSIFDRPSELFKLFEPLIGKKSIQYKNGISGRQFRQVVDRNFSHQAVMNYLDCFQEPSTKMAKEWLSMDEGQHIPIMESMFSLAIKSMAKAGLGKSFNSDKDIKLFTEAYTTCWNELESQLGTPPPQEGSDRKKAFEKGKEHMRTVIRTLIQSRRKGSREMGERLFIDSMIDCDQIDEEELEDDILTFMIGGFHTTATMMVWCFYYLAIHPEIQEKVYNELIEVLGEEELKPQCIADLIYCRQVIDETLRCAVVAPWGARVQMDHDLKIGEYIVPKQTPILTPFGVVLQDPEIFPEPQRFDPDRFNPEIVKDRPSLAYQPFGFAGKRKCPGWRFSIAEGLVFMSVFFRRFKVKLVKEQKVEPVYRLVTSPKEEFWVTVCQR